MRCVESVEKNAFLYGKYWSVVMVCEVKCVVVCMLFVGLCVVCCCLCIVLTALCMSVLAPKTLRFLMF